MPKTTKKQAEKTVKKTTKPVKVKAVATKVAVKKTPVQEKLRNYFYANGKRKTATALVRLFPDGKGVITINERPFEKYFPVFIDREKILSPLKVTNLAKQMDIMVKVFGGGVHAQAEAVRHGVSKALLHFKPEARSQIKPLGFLTRDSRVKERKKYGLKRARRAPQWQKR